MFHRRSLFLINKTFQLRFAFYTCSWLIALSFVYPLIIFNLFEYLMRYLALDPMGPAVSNLEQTREDLLWLLVIMEGILLSLTFLISIFMSHKIAGPLYKLRRFFREAAAGNLEQKLSFRKKDYFQELVGDYNQMMTSIQGRLAKKADGIQLAISKIERALLNTPPESRSDLEAALRALQDSLKP